MSRRPRTRWARAAKWMRRIAVGLIGGLVLVIGIAMIVLPGPAILMIPAGLAILALEFAWARLWLKRVRRKARSFTASKPKNGAGPP